MCVLLSDSGRPERGALICVPARVSRDSPLGETLSLSLFGSFQLSWLRYWLKGRGEATRLEMRPPCLSRLAPGGRGRLMRARRWCCHLMDHSSNDRGSNSGGSLHFFKDPSGQSSFGTPVSASMRDSCSCSCSCHCFCGSTCGYGCQSCGLKFKPFGRQQASKLARGQLSRALPPAALWADNSIKTPSHRQT